MKHANEITLILPEYIAMDSFLDIVNNALKKSDGKYEHFYWDALQAKEVHQEMIHSKYQLKPVAAGNGRILVEFERERDS